MSPRRPRVLTWAVHGSYLRYLAAADADLLIPVERSDELAGYPDNVIGVPSDRLDTLDVDLVLYQSVIHWRDRERLLPARLLTAPAAYVEHDPPREHPTDTRHPAADEDVLLVHVTHYNALMWDAGRAVAASSYGIGRFAADWEHVFDAVRGRALPARASGARADELGAVRS